MITELKEYTVTKTKKYWTCTNNIHRHTSKRVAEACIARQEKPRKMDAQNKWTKDKLVELLSKWRSGGITKKALGQLYGVSGNHIRLMILKAERLLEGK